jgi:signal transduction histidine kinase
VPAPPWREVGSSKELGVAHARHRFAAEFTAGEALRELSHFRIALLDLSEEVIGPIPSADAILLHTTIDELMAVSATELEHIELNRFEQVMAVVAHDLKTPLQVVAGHAQLLKEGTPMAGSDCATVGAALERSAIRISRLVDDLRITSELELGHLSIQNRRVDVRSIIADVLKQMSYAANRKSITLNSTVPEQPVDAECDPDRIEQALENVVSNAIRFTPTGGHVRVDLKASLKQAMVRVFDEGPGIPPEHYEHVFRPFWKGSSPSSVNMGLGLSIARGIIETHGGTIFVKNSPGTGTVFCFTIPLDKSENSCESIDLTGGPDKDT